ncbi:hypothetical protein COU01_02870 [Candidatus Falkowbacteria bacterium CG10_big_fil_rev_8_21_14_0_10_44_15]|uniref:HTH cro/C1-type domain-containing protein n=1 Tax=Candidatus Falkowbacteria bacterium CG10_big_fil_rev_8_21_14_0_10_44_15 TaxID=1974569 RepID=A0A2H0UZD2_9BACT|nr:MAG: hypothetical protein COU01_02870 [Candidatus Falkowbacteria bacterium CG10_big_fil_rev_8_21_14_0_10_44_15]
MKYFFKKKNIADASVGEILQEHRRRKNISLEAAAAATKINVKYLRALENGDCQSLPSGVYARNFLREYCFWLGLNSQPMLEAFEGEINLTKVDAGGQEIFSRQRPRWYYFLSLPKVARNTILVIVILGGLGYLGWRIQQIIAPPALAIMFPPESYLTAENKITLLGRTERETRLTVNGSEVLSDEAGNFSEEVNLTAGLNVITVKAKKRYSREAEAVRQVLVK